MNWHKSTAQERNAACGALMPKSATNPLSRWGLAYNGKPFGQIPLPIPNRDNAEAWLNTAKSSKKRWSELVGETFPGGCPWVLRHDVGVIEVTWHVRYSDTPGGAWMLVEQLVGDGFAVTVRSSVRATTVAIDKYPPRPIDMDGKVHPGGGFFLELPRPMPEVVAAAFLMFKGIDITNI